MEEINIPDPREEKTKKTKKRVWPKLLKLVLVMAVVGGLLYFLAPKWLPLIAPSSMEATLKKQAKSLEYTGDVEPYFYSCGQKGFYHATADGVTFRAVDTEEKMVSMYSLNAPVYKGEGDIFAVGEHQGKNLYVYTPQDLLYEVETENPIICFSINKEGYSVVVTKNKDTYDVFVYNKEGNLQSEGGAIGHKEVFPIAVDISNDNRIIAISSLDISKLTMSTKVTFVYTKPKDSIDIKDGIYAATKDYTDEVIGQVTFMQDNKVIILSDQALRIFEGEGEGEPIFELTFHNKVTHFVELEDELFALGYGEDLLNQEKSKTGMVEVYNLEGELVHSVKGKGIPSYLSYGHNSLIIGYDRDFTAIDHRGREKWEYTAGIDGALVIPISGNNVLVAGKNEADLFRVVSTRKTLPIRSQE